MKIANKLRWVMAAGVMVATLLFLLFLFFATQSIIDVWDRLQQLPEWLFYTYSSIIAAIIIGSGTFVYRLLTSGSKPGDTGKSEPVNEKQLRSELDLYEESGMDATPLRDELAQLQSRKDSGQINIAFFGDVSTGKSSIIKALLPEADIKTSLRGGSTREIKEYLWQTASGDRLLLTDLPGRNEAEGELDELVRDEAVRAQMVVYVMDSDFSRTQHEDVQQLLSFGKPMLLAFNKSDQYTEAERQLLTQRIEERLPAEKGKKSLFKIVFIQSGGNEEILKIYPDGREETLIRPREPNVTALIEQMQQEIDGSTEWLEQLRDASVFTLVKHKLDESRENYLRNKAEKIVRTATRNAILGSMAALSPGTDIIIQGVLGAKMVKDLCTLYDSPMSQVDIDDFLDFSQGQIKKSIPILLAVAGNGLKAFPGIGTVAGGLVHAVAYGLIFDALGHSVASTLEKRGELKAAPAALTFREMLSGNLEDRTKTFTRLVVDQYRRKNN
ncbi:MAG: GTP-binding protein [uncultured Thiotrichaceae bacterium]|uniref:GTP-binding protein n=1 Tax=uncultured Thiotrichaceae bacterium TaxID=298394 RepID=A0A6S6T028_9GAMM|nr:MAG: GTP-binding protein [uncultured Thiotrichaceae bacterium]